VRTEIWQNNGSGGFTQTQTLDGTFSSSLALGDLNADGRLDIVVAGFPRNEVWLNTGSNFASSTSFIGKGVAKDIALGDLNNDGDLDVFVANWDANGFITENPDRNKNQVWFNDTPLTVRNFTYTIPEHTTLNVAAPGILADASDLDGPDASRADEPANEALRHARPNNLSGLSRDSF
jgi:hypothetical protein